MSSLLSDLRIADAARRLAGVTLRTPLLPFRPAALDERIELRLKLECQQETRSFKARGAWNQVSQLTEGERAQGVVATSSGNHGQALAWAARRAGVPATIYMPADSYPNKIAACRSHGAEVVLTADRREAEALCRARVEAGAVLIHPYDAERTIEGAGTVGLEIAQDWPEVEVCVFPVGGGGLAAGSSLALRQTLGAHVRTFGVEPVGAPTMTCGLAAGEPVDMQEITTAVQGLCPIQSGSRNVAVCLQTLDDMFTLTDDAIYAAQRLLILETGEAVEPAGAAAAAFVLSEVFAAELLADRSAAEPLRVAAVVSGGNPDPEQLASLIG